LFKALVLVALLVLTTLAVGSALVMRSLIRANRVAPGRRSAAPLSWLASPRRAPRLHRRLRRAVAASNFAVGTMAPAAVPLCEVAGELVQRAVSLDDWLVATLGLHLAARRYRLAQLTAEVREIEVSAARLHQLSSDWRRCLDQATEETAIPLPDLHQRLDAVEAALRELPPAPSLTPDERLPRLR
jgi:FAD/FMN-containing dehydrogenase